MIKCFLTYALLSVLTVAPVYGQEGRAIGPNPTAIGQAAVGQIPATTTNDNACVGCLGEYRSASTADTGTSQASSTVTITIASPAVITWGTTLPYIFNGIGAAVINFTTTGALPTGIVAGTNYYVIGSSVSGNTFQIATSADNAIAGTAINTSGSQSGVQTGVPTAILASGANIISAISLTAGDWDVNSAVVFLSTASTSITALGLSVSLSNTSISTVPGRIVGTTQPAYVPGVANTYLQTSPTRFSLSGATTLYEIVNPSFTVSTLSGWGGIRARRVR